MAALSLERQKTFIAENAALLNTETRMQILTVTILSVGHSVVSECGPAKDAVIDLDAVSATNPELITHIYNLVAKRRDALNNPAT
jgi:hypothetical protein